MRENSNGRIAIECSPNVKSIFRRVYVKTAFVFHLKLLIPSIILNDLRNVKLVPTGISKTSNRIVYRRKNECATPNENNRVC